MCNVNESLDDLGGFRAIMVDQAAIQLERIQGHPGLQLPQVAAAEAVQVLVEVDDAHRVEGVGVEAAVEGHDRRAGREDVVGHGLEHGLREAFVDGAVGHVDAHARQARLLGPFKLFQGVGGHEDLGVAGERTQPLPVGRPLEQQQNALGLRGFQQAQSQVVQGSELLGEPQGLHTLSVGVLPGAHRWRETQELGR